MPDRRKFRSQISDNYVTTSTTITTTTAITTRLQLPANYNYNYNFNFNYGYSYNYNYTTSTTRTSTTTTNITHYTTTTSTTTTTTTTTRHCIQQLWARRPLQPLRKAQLQPPFGASVGSLCICDSQQPTSLMGFLSLKLALPPLRYYWYGFYL